MFRKHFKKRKLISLVDRLAIYNDKGIAWSNHSELEASQERKKLIEAIRLNVQELGVTRFPNSFLDALESGDLETDITGKYIDIVKSI